VEEFFERDLSDPQGIVGPDGRNFYLQNDFPIDNVHSDPFALWMTLNRREAVLPAESLRPSWELNQTRREL
jgi:hypothetical protein